MSVLSPLKRLVKPENPLLAYHFLGTFRGKVRRHAFLYGLLLLTVGVFYGLFLLLVARYSADFEIRQLGTFYLFFTALIVPLFAHSQFATEYEKATWELLALTRLSAKEIFRGKWGASVLMLALLTLSAVPFFVPLIASGYDFGEILSLLVHSAFALMIAFSWGGLLISVGTWVAYFTRRTISAIALTYAFQVITLLLLPLLFAVFDAFASEPFYEDLKLDSFSSRVEWWLVGLVSGQFVFWFNPFYALSAFSEPSSWSTWDERYSIFNGWLWVQSAAYLLIAIFPLMHTYHRLRRDWRKWR